VLALVTERSGGLLAAMLVHGFWNGATILMTVSVFGS
jgi:membrane protease YdiL (CAAX protease family)